ncbi:MAG: Ig-like domain-containing protein [Fulvivirga sp.]|uniref:Ig-like domain-containing protein n=1 Tax=Fulvivirga sp. TaxID=1931237 RepID=UPI0032EB4C6E
MKKILLFLLSAVVLFSCTEESIETITPQFEDGEKTITIVLSNIPEGLEGEDVYIFTLNNKDEVFYIQAAVANEDEEVITIPTPGGSAYSLVAYIPTIDEWTSKDPFSEGWYSGVSSSLNKTAKFVTNSWTEDTDLNKTGVDEVLEVELAVSGDSSYVQGEIFVLSATTTDNVAAGVTSVAFALNGSVLETINEEPYSINVNTVDFPAGKHIVSVTATNGNGDTATDEIEIEITVNENTAPEVSVSAALVGNGGNGTGAVDNGDQVERQELVTISASVSDANLQSVEFIIDGSTVYTATPDDPFSFEWDTFDNSVGIITIEVAATDTDGATRSAFLNVTLVDPDNFIPRATLNTPSNGANFSETDGDTVTFNITATDQDGDAVFSAEVFLPAFGAFGLGQIPDTEQWEVTLGGFPAGTFEWEARVYDNSGRYTKTNVRSFTFN